MTSDFQLGILGCGEAGRAIGKSLFQASAARPIGFDIKASCQHECAELSDLDGVRVVCDRSDLAHQAKIIISVVTADAAEQAAEQLCPHLSAGHIFMDGNSVSPVTKQNIAQMIAPTGASYIDMAIMAPIHPRGHKTPILLAGRMAEQINPILDKYGFSYQWQGDEIGQASMVKMLRSILIKGVESLICECVTAAHFQGLDTHILESAGQTLGIEDMPALADYVMERVARHGRRRAAELREVAKTLDELGVSNHLPTAIARHQDMIADLNLHDHFSGDIPEDRAQLASVMREGQKQK